MDARQLLQSIEARGGAATVKTDSSGAAKINVAPRSLALELLPDLQRFKPALLELLGAPVNSEPATATPFRRANEFVFVPCDFEAAPSVARIAALLQSFEPLFTAARRGHVPNSAAAVCELEKAWSDRARECQREQRGLTGAELSALESAGAWLGDLAREREAMERREAPEVRR